MIDDDASFKEYLQWASSSLDIKYSNSITIRDYDNDKDIERGIMNTSIIPKQTILFSVPLTSLLSIQSIALHAPILLPLIQILKEDDILSLLLIYEKFKGKESKWYQHIDILPKHYDSLPNFNQIEIEELKGFTNTTITTTIITVITIITPIITTIITTIITPIITPIITIIIKVQIYIL